MWLYGYELLILVHHAVKIGGRRHFGSGDINICANKVILLQMWDVTFMRYVILSNKYQIEEIFVTQAFSSERNEIFPGLGTAILGNNL